MREICGNNTHRKSNIELLRVVSMFMVLMVHASFLALGSPSKEYMLSYPCSTFLRCFSQSLSIVCVNCFIIISGWFGIRPRISRLFELLFQVAFFCVISFLVCLFFHVPINEDICDYWKDVFFSDGFWFFRAYVILWLFSPVLNAFVEHSERRQLKSFLVAFFVIQTMLSHKVGWFSRGYSPLSFMGLYLMACYLRKYPSRITSFSHYTYLISYVVISILITCVALFVIYFHVIDVDTLYAYSSPLVILSSISFFMFFVKLSFTSRLVNCIAVSAFSIYLFHCNPLFFKPIYLTHIRDWYSLDVWTFLCHLSCFMCIIMVSSIIIDKYDCIFGNYLLKL